MCMCRMIHVHVCLETMCVKCDRCRLTAGITNLTGVAAHQKSVWDKGETSEMII